MVSIGQRIKYLRLKEGLTQQQLAERMGGISASTIGMYEQGRRCPDMERIIKFGKVFSVSTDNLLGVREEILEASEIFDELKNKVSQSKKITLNGSLMDDESRERLLKAIEFISSVMFSNSEPHN